MKQLISILSILLILSGCDPVRYSEPKETKYTVVVNYTNNGYGTTPPTDTIVIYSLNEPHLFVDEGVSCLVADHNYTPHATYVRSFKILEYEKLVQ
jgi:hypothetical protein